jgi:hypothetical protein
MATPDPSSAPSPPQSPPKPKALFVISSGRTLPLAQPGGHPGISTGFFLVEMAKVLQAFGDDYDLVFATPDGRPPQLDVNGMALNFHAVPGLGAATTRAAVAQSARSSSATTSSERSRRCPSTPTTRRGSWWNATATPRTRSSCVTSRSSTCPAGTPR